MSSPPTRRSFLVSVGTLATLSPAGCLGDDGSSIGDWTETDTTATTGPDPSTTEPSSEGTRETATLSVENVGGAPPQVGVESEREKPIAVVTVGSRENVEDPADHQPHGIWIWNDSDERRGISFEVRHGGEVVRSAIREFPPDAYLALFVLEPVDYTLTVGLDGSDSTTEIEIPADWVDCNESAMGVLVHADGSIETRGFTTDMLCSTPTAETTP